MRSKIWPSAADALAGVVADGMTIAVGGFGLSGNPTNLIRALRDTGAKNLTIVSNNMGVDGKGLGLLLENKQVAPQGTLAERLRAGGAGIPGFYTPTGVGTPIADGKPEAEFDGRRVILERGIVADVALVRARWADAAGNLRYRLTARNFNPLVATAGKLTVAEAEEIVDGFIDPDDVVTPGIFVQRLVQCDDMVKEIEQRTVRPQESAHVDA
jgi:3-oxoacid CoA-transferase subunit A